MDLPSSPPPPLADGGNDPDTRPAEARGVDGGSRRDDPVPEPRSPWGLAGLTLVAATVLSGLPLVLSYRPVPAWVAADLTDLREIGGLAYVHKLHGGLAQAAVLAMWLLILWLAVRGVHRFEDSASSDSGPSGRRTWALALTGLALVMAWATSGRLLRWDAPSREALGPWLGAGDEGSSVLLAIWALHCVLLPALGILALRLLRSGRRDGRRDSGEKP